MVVNNLPQLLFDFMVKSAEVLLKKYRECQRMGSVAVGINPYKSCIHSKVVVYGLKIEIN